MTNRSFYFGNCKYKYKYFILNVTVLSTKNFLNGSQCPVDVCLNLAWLKSKLYKPPVRRNGYENT